MIRGTRVLLYVIFGMFSVELHALQWDRVLVPLSVVFQTGAYGSIWKTEFVVRNDSDEAIDFYRLSCNFEGCIVGEFPAKQTTIQPSLLAWGDGTALPRGLMLHVEAGRAEKLAFHLLLRNDLPTACSPMIALPVVRQEAFFRYELQILAVPVSPRVRQTLRIYDLDEIDDEATFLVRFRDLASDAVISTIEVRTDAGFSEVVSDGENPPTRLFPVPGFLQIDRLADVFPELLGVEFLRIEVERPDGERFWAFVSVTDNTTQAVTIYSP